MSRKTAAWISGAIIATGAGSAILVVVTAGSGPAAARTGTRVGTRATTRPIPAKPVPLRLVSVSPANGAAGANGAGDITVTYNQPLPATAALPTLRPAIAGTWKRHGDTVVFTPATGYQADTKVTVTVPRPGGTRDRSGYSASFTTGGYRTLRLQQILAQLGYLPLTWRPARNTAIDGQSAAAQLAAAYQPPPGTFGWQPGYPARLRSLWTAGSPNTLDKGAITAFEADHGMTIDETVSPKVWAALLKAAAAGQRNTHGYSYAIASEHLPETLTIWHNGKKVFSSLANTGISVAPTPIGTFPVYEKLPFQVMQGTNPDGSHYADPVQWVSYFSGGSAVHYIARGSYGWPQSLGCVELPYAAAKNAYPYLPYGTLVTVVP